MAKRRVLALVALLSVGLGLAGAAPSGLGGQPARAVGEGDGGSGGDAGNTFDDATLVPSKGFIQGTLEASAGDTDDYFKFTLAKDAFMSVLVSLRNTTLTPDEPVELLDPNGVVIDAGVPFASTGYSTSGLVTSELQLRLSVHKAVVPGDYRLHVQTGEASSRDYQACFMNCEGLRDAPIDTVFGGSLPTKDTKVLLVPPTHGDMGNPMGPKVTDYIDATLRGIRRWRGALDAFATDHPRYSYLKDISIDVEVFDGVTPMDPLGYDVVLGYAAAGPVFRGVATDADQNLIEPIVAAPFGPEKARYTGRMIVLSLFGASPRAGQVLYDFPEVVDLEMVTMHEFGHTFGLGHTVTWHPQYGSDLMNSPATFIYGDGWAAGDGGERTPMNCLSSLDLYGMAYLYRWIPSGTWQPSFRSVRLPQGIEYSLYCG